MGGFWPTSWELCMRQQMGTFCAAVGPGSLGQVAGGLPGPAGNSGMERPERPERPAGVGTAI